jgi:hypothetical protein
MNMHNYPDGMDWQAFDDYTDPVLACCERRASSCNCPECDKCDRVYGEDHEWGEIPETGEIVCRDCYENYKEEKEDD